MIDAFISRFNGMTEPYFFYGGEVELRYEPREHVYYLIKDGQFVAQDGVTNIVHIIDKSAPLIAWACKQMAAKLFLTVPVMQLPTGERIIPQQSYEDFEKLVLAAKNAHKEKLEEAADIGHIAHDWIERYIKAVLAENEQRKLELLAKFPENEKSRNCCLAALDWMQRHNVRWICTEQKIYSRRFRYAGTMDGKAIVDSCDKPSCCLVPFKDHRSIIDWKSSNYLYLEYLYQTAAYQYAHVEETGAVIDDRWVIRLGKEDGEFDPWHVDGRCFRNDFDGFRLALELTRNVRAVEERIKDQTDKQKAERKAEEQAVRDAANKIKCPKADKFKGMRYPKCNDGPPCKTCLEKYEQNGAVKEAAKRGSKRDRSGGAKEAPKETEALGAEVHSVPQEPGDV